MKRILMTGSSGYVGSNLKPYLEQHMNAVVVEYDIKHGMSVLDIGRLERSCIGIDAIIHLAAISSIIECEQKPYLSHETNVVGTENVTASARKHGLKLVFASSVAANRPANIYGWTKLIGEHIVLNCGGVVLRLANVYGGRFIEKSDGVYARFKRVNESGEEAVIYGNGLQERDFVHMSDVCNAFHIALESESGTYEVSSGATISILELAKTLEAKYRFGEGIVGLTVNPNPSKWLPKWIPKHTSLVK